MRLRQNIIPYIYSCESQDLAISLYKIWLIHVENLKHSILGKKTQILHQYVKKLIN